MSKTSRTIDTTLLDKQTPITDEDLKAFFRKHDYTSHASTTADKTDPIFMLVRDQFEKEWNHQLADKNGQVPRNLAQNHPIKMLGDRDADIVASKVAEIFDDEKLSAQTAKICAAVIEKPMQDALASRAKQAGKTVDELDEDELEQTVRQISYQLYSTMMEKFMTSQSVPEMMEVVKKNGAHEDFNQSVKENHDRIDFERK